MGKGPTQPAEASNRAEGRGKERGGSKGGVDDVGDEVSSARTAISSEIANGISDAEETVSCFGLGARGSGFGSIVGEEEETTCQP